MTTSWVVKLIFVVVVVSSVVGVSFVVIAFSVVALISVVVVGRILSRWLPTVSGGVVSVPFSSLLL